MDDNLKEIRTKLKKKRKSITLRLQLNVSFIFPLLRDLTKNMEL